jgi:SAM-dependent MidA family methyltransferase
MGRPDPVVLAEAGPGRGTLMADALRAIARAAPDFRSALRLHLVETSPRLRELQARVLPGATWHDSPEELPPGPMLLLANEFLDALPVRQFVRRGDRWAERFVERGAFIERAVSPSSWLGLIRPPRVMVGEGRPSTTSRAGSKVVGPRDKPEDDDGVLGQVLEICEPALAIAQRLGSRLADSGGAALFLDYGPVHSTTGESLQALGDGRPVDPLSEPGSADLTAHVDFAAIAHAARDAGAAVYGPLPQGKFLAALGLFQRTDRLARGQSPARAMALIEAARRLAEPDRMGRLFKALALCHPGAPAPPGFES